MTLQDTLDEWDGFRYPQRVAVDASGHIYVLDYGEASVFKFDPLGYFETRLGQEGRGPAEFITPLYLGFRGDTLWVGDINLARVSRITASGAIEPQAFFRIVSGRSLYVPQRLLADGSFLSLAILRNTASPRVVDGLAPLVRMTGEGDVIDTLAIQRVARAQLLIEPIPRGGRYRTPHPFSESAFVAVDPHGRHVYVVDTNRFARTGGAHSISILKLGVAGDTIFARHLERAAVRTDGGFSDRFRAAEFRKLRRSLGVDSEREFSDVYMTHVEIPEILPPLTEVVAGSDGSLWVRGEDLWREAVVWRVYDTGGSLAGRVEIPREWRVLWVDGEMFWVARPTAFDLWVAEQYELR